MFSALKFPRARDLVLPEYSALQAHLQKQDDQ
jgi:hypothetical protein